jgi:hypothetical protein
MSADHDHDHTAPVDLGGLAPLSEESGLCGGPGQISCSEANELIQHYLDHITDPDTGERVAEHLGDCPPCETEFVVYQRIVESLSRCRPQTPPDTRERLERFCRDLACDDA